MRFNRKVACVLVAMTLRFSQALQAAEPAPPTLAGHALLVGCTTYPDLPVSFHLLGPGNDVLLMRDMLTRRFGMPTEHVVVLAEASGQERLRPTRANIQREFQRLIDQATSGDQVVILLAGHGSQQPDQDPPSSDDPEPDGMDEIFLPSDVKKWDGGRGQVPNAIVDDEFRGWLQAIQAKGAAVWVIMDACHSGTMTRGVEEYPRQILPDMLVPQAVLDRASARAKDPQERSRGNAPPINSMLKLDASKAALVALYAAQSTEVTVEKLLPPQGQDRKRYGLLTYTISQVLEQATRPITYAELVQRVQAQYVNWGRTSPTPLVEGVDKDREVLGQRKWPGRSRVLLEQVNGALRINAGSLHGLTAGSVLAVYPSTAEAAREPAGYVKIVSLRTIHATVEPSPWDGPAVKEKDLPIGGWCESVYIDYGVDTLRVAVDDKDFVDQPIPATQRQSLSEVLGVLAKKNGALIRVDSDAADADWVLRVRGDDVFLVPAAGWPTVDDARLAPFGPAPPREKLGAWLENALRKIARAENLKRLATSASSEMARGDEGISARLELRLDSQNSRGTPLDSRQGGVKVYDSDRVTCVVHNPNRMAADVTLLYVDSGYGITPVFPASGELNRLQAGESMPVKLEVTAETAGMEHLVLIAVKADGQPVDFTSLAQPTIEQARTRGRGMLESPLGKLFQQALYAEGSTRGVRRGAVNDYSLGMVTWTISTRPRPVENRK